MDKMLCNTGHARKGRCHYGRRCCGSILDYAGHKRKRRAVKRSERNAWKRSITRD